MQIYKTIGRLELDGDKWNYGLQYGRDYHDKSFVLCIFFFKFVKYEDRKMFSNEMKKGVQFTFKIHL